MSRLRNRIIGLLAALALTTTTLGACGGTQPVTPQSSHANTNQPQQHKDGNKTTDVVMDPTFVQHFMTYKNATTAEQVASGMQNRVPDDFLKVKGRDDGAVIITVTEQQRQKEIKSEKDDIARSRKTFLTGCTTGTPCGYRLNLAKNGKSLSVWLDKHLTVEAYTASLIEIPLDEGYLYYFTGGTGPWDMQITIHNCHSGQMVNQHMATQGLDATTDNFGD
ncbi:hypothetical protein OZX74_00870 [Bifidobacterium sp. ESL0798]|uniref:hypothetical protein n=1 Tax=Bifidobacterium sp. ESL0798 TaxID=2983235 RepID=UPI0023FA27BC|nr:hypothetical protein [Bifidobacterium sp. ESL0798]WEV74151.1 hypothetical protein OZX74_00870 [Bifidobacterium sp. ESL0798]